MISGRPQGRKSLEVGRSGEQGKASERSEGWTEWDSSGGQVALVRVGALEGGGEAGEGRTDRPVAELRHEGDSSHPRLSSLPPFPIRSPCCRLVRSCGLLLYLSASWGNIIHLLPTGASGSTTFCGWKNRQRPFTILSSGLFLIGVCREPVLSLPT